MSSDEARAGSAGFPQNPDLPTPAVPPDAPAGAPGRTMRAVRFKVSIPGFLLARTLGRYTESALFGGLSGVSFAEVPAPSLPGEGWVRIRVLLAGICGSDLGNLTYRSSTAMEPFGSFPAIPGHEVVGVVEAVGSAVTRVAPGDRVVVDPMLSCRARGHATNCPSCASGLHSTCERAGDEGGLLIGGHPLARGLTIGYHRDLPGGWGERVLAHEEQCFPVPAPFSDEAAVLIEPLSIGVHAALRALSRPIPGPILVIGSGPIALGTIWAIRALGFEGEIVGQAKRPHEQELALALGATSVVTPGKEARAALLATGARGYRPIVGPEVFGGGGYPYIFDCVGNGGSLRQALSSVTPRGRIGMLGCSAEIPRLDLTFVWARELHIEGFVGYGMESFEGERIHTFEVTTRLLDRGGFAEVERLITHTFPLARYREALSAAADHRRSGAVKVLLRP